MKEKKVEKIMEITFQDLLKSDAMTMDEHGNTYIYGYPGGDDMGAMKIDTNGHVKWAKRYVMDLGIYNNYTSLAAKSVKLINGYLWCVSVLYLYKVDPESGEVLASISISDKGNIWMHANDVLQAGNDIMLMMPGGVLQYRVLRVSDLKALRHVKIDFADTKPATAFPSHTIHQVSGDRFFAISDYRSQNGFFATPILVEFDSQGKVYNSAIFYNTGDVIITKVNKNAQGQYAVTFNVVTSTRENLKSHDVLIFDKNLQLVNKHGLDRKYRNDAFPIDKSNIATINPANLSFDWIDIANPRCLAEKYQTVAVPKDLNLKDAVIVNNPQPYTELMKFVRADNLTTSSSNFAFNQTSTTICNN